MSHKCKDGETKKLAKAIFQTIDFIDLGGFSIETGYTYYEHYNIFGHGKGYNVFGWIEIFKFSSYCCNSIFTYSR
jgi:hypothetical protein